MMHQTSADNNVELTVIDKVNGKPVVLETERLRLKERIGLSGGIAFIVGSLIGSGIFISPRGAFANAGSLGLSLVIWALCGFLSMILGFVYAELGVIMPKSGGDYTYIREGVGKIPAFLVAWTQCTIAQAGSRAVLALAFADYVCAPIFGKCTAPDSIRKSIAAVELLLLAITNCISVHLIASIQGIFTVIKFIALVIITVGGFIYLGQGHLQNFDNSFEGTTNDVTAISLSIYSCMWAYEGYDNLNEIAEELIEPKRNIPRAICISLTLVTIIYLTTNVSYFTILTTNEFLTVPAVAFIWGERVLGAAAIIIPLSVMCSVHGASNGGMFTDARVRFAASRSGHLPEVLSFLHHQSRIPTASLVFNTIISILMLIPADISELINIVIFMRYLSKALTIIALLRMRYDRRNQTKEEGAFRSPLIVPVFALLVCLFMIVSPFVNSPKIEFLYGVAFVVSGLLLYFPFVYFQLKIPGFDKVTMYTQLLLNLCPTVPEEDLGI